MRHIDMKGQRFGRLVVVKKSDKTGATRAVYWDCQCDCGNTKTARGTSLRAGKVNSCGCLLEDRYKSGSTKINIIGQRFGRLMVVEESPERTKCGEVKYLCQCDCGNTKVVAGTALRYGKTRSCGCLLSESTSERASTHGRSKTRLYRIWAGMRDRCYNPSRKEYKDYGGRGITVCDEWNEDFEAFHDWSIKNGYSEDLTIDRIENNGPYSPDNCRWATRKTQSDNTRQVVHIAVGGVSKNIEGWAAAIGVSRSTISRHLKIGDAEEYISKRLK